MPYPYRTLAIMALHNILLVALNSCSSFIFFIFLFGTCSFIYSDSPSMFSIAFPCSLYVQCILLGLCVLGTLAAVFWKSLLDFFLHLLFSKLLHLSYALSMIISAFFGRTTSQQLPISSGDMVIMSIIHCHIRKWILHSSPAVLSRFSCIAFYPSAPSPISEKYPLPFQFFAGFLHRICHYLKSHWPSTQTFPIVL